MHCDWKKFMLLAFATAFVLGVTVPPAYAIWHVLLDESFNNDPQNQNLRWPWFTDLRYGRRWHWNPYPNYFRAEGNPSNYCWGLQNEFFNRSVRPEDEFQFALWCAYTNLNDAQNPRWPDGEYYMPLQNAWVWWGESDPEEARVSLENAVSANVSFWMYLDLENYARDSLSFFALTDPNLLTCNGATFAARVPVGKTYSHRINNDWVWQSCYLDSLHVRNRPDSLISMLGEPMVFIGFVWQSDSFAVAEGDYGAFIDDVIFSWDDGLFDVYPENNYFGYRVNQDSINWSVNEPRRDEQVYFKATYRVIGIGDTPEFSIQLLHNNELMYSTVVTQEGADDTTFTVIADTLWTAVSGHHDFRWEFDAPTDEGGVIGEADENNNVLSYSLDVTYNPPPVLSLVPAGSDTVDLDGMRDLSLRYTITDEQGENRFNTAFYWTPDTAGLAADPSIVDRFGYIGRQIGVPAGEGEFIWRAYGLGGYVASVDADSVFKIVGVATDGFPGNFSIVVSSNAWRWSLSAPLNPWQPVSFGLTDAYPNPFNNSIRFDFALPHESSMSLSVFDLAGHQVADLYHGRIEAGIHSASWQPGGLPAGVYLARLESGGQVSMRKIVYMP